MIRPYMLLISIFLSNVVFAQNHPPSLSNINLVKDTVTHFLTITYDLADNESDPVEVLLRASANNGISYEINTGNATGDIGFPVTTVLAKQIVWDYPDSLSSMLLDFRIKLIADDQVPFDIQYIVDQIDSNKIRQHVAWLEGIRHRFTGAAHLQAVKDSMVNIFQRYGLHTRLHEFPFSAYTGQNIIGRKQGIDDAHKTYIVDGHYDTVNDSPGADDNGSGIGAILEMVRIFSSLHLRHSINFIGFDLEEAGLAGSEEFVKTGIMDYEQIEGVINMDMIGYFSNVPFSQTLPAGFEFAFPDLYAELVANDFRANFIISTANSFSSPLLMLYDSMAAQHVPELLVGSIEVPGNGELIPDSRRSDHAAFWDSGYMALHLSDGAETRNPNYHDPTDVLDSVNYTFTSHVAKAVAATVLNLAKPMHADVVEIEVSSGAIIAVRNLELDACQFTIAPNPSAGPVQILVNNCVDGKAEFKIISLNGKTVWQEKFFTGKEARINISPSLPPGYYFMEMQIDQKIYSGKIVLQ